MARLSTVIGIVCLCFFVAGCSGYRTLNIHTAPLHEKAGISELDRIKPGDTIKLTLRGGTKVKGEAMTRSAEFIVLENPRLENSSEDRFDEVARPTRQQKTNQQKFMFEDIEEMEKYESSIAKSLGTAAVIAGVVYLIVYGMQHTLDDFDLDLDTSFLVSHP